MFFDLNKVKSSPFIDTEFFVLFFSEKSLDVTIEGASDGFFDTYFSDNLIAITSKSPNAASSMLYEDSRYLRIFRGYDLDLGIQTYSLNQKKSSIISLGTLKNGVFIFFEWDSESNRLSLKTDALGVSPIFYKQLGDKHLFSSHPILLTSGKESLDHYAIMSIVQNDFIFGDRTIYKNIRRVKPGVIGTISQNKLCLKEWFDFSSLSGSDDNVTDSSFELIEDACRIAIKKATNLNNKNFIVPLSSGYDSRRILCNLKIFEDNIQTFTCRSLHNKAGRYYDIDSKYAPLLAKKLCIDNKILSMDYKSELLNFDYVRTSLYGTETLMHLWAVPLIKEIKKQEHSIIFDGLGGDSIGNGGWEFDGMRSSPIEDVNIVFRNTVNKDIFKFFSDKYPSPKEFSEEYFDNLKLFNINNNAMELAFFSYRTRRAIAPWILMACPIGHTVVFPYLDTYYVQECLRYTPRSRYSLFFQKECLRRFWPEIYDLPGTRNLPKDLTPVSKVEQQQYVNLLTESSRNNLSFSDLKNHYSLISIFLFYLVRVLLKQKNYRFWLYQPILQLLSADRTKGYIKN